MRTIKEYTERYNEEEAKPFVWAATCFWCVEADLEKVDGVKDRWRSGYGPGAWAQLAR